MFGLMTYILAGQVVKFGPALWLISGCIMAYILAGQGVKFWPALWLISGCIMPYILEWQGIKFWPALWLHYAQILTALWLHYVQILTALCSQFSNPYLAPVPCIYLAIFTCIKALFSHGSHITRTSHAIIYQPLWPHHTFCLSLSIAKDLQIKYNNNMITLTSIIGSHYIHYILKISYTFFLMLKKSY